MGPEVCDIRPCPDLAIRSILETGTNERRLIPILDITIVTKSEGFTTEWVLTCSWCGKPADRGDHADCDTVIIDAPEQELSPSCQ